MKTPMYQCQSIWNGETNQVEDCTCGRCQDSLNNSKDLENKVTTAEKEMSYKEMVTEDY